MDCKTCVYFDDEQGGLYKFEKDGYCEYWGDWITVDQICDQHLEEY